MSYTKEELIEKERQKQRQKERQKERHYEYHKLNPHIKKKCNDNYTAKNNIPITCICGYIVKKFNIKRHERTLKHFDKLCIKHKIKM